MSRPDLLVERPALRQTAGAVFQALGPLALVLFLVPAPWVRAQDQTSPDPTSAANPAQDTEAQLDSGATELPAQPPNGGSAAAGTEEPADPGQTGTDPATVTDPPGTSTLSSQRSPSTLSPQREPGGLDVQTAANAVDKPSDESPAKPWGPAFLLAMALALLSLAASGVLFWRLRLMERHSDRDRKQLDELRAEVKRLSRDPGSPTKATPNPGRFRDTTATTGSRPETSGRAATGSPTAPDKQSSGIDYDALQRNLQTIPQGDIGLPLLHLHQQARRLASCFGTPEAREQFQQDFGPQLLNRLQRFATAAENSRLSSWVETDLLELLNQLARHLSVAAEQAHRLGGDDQLAQQLSALLYQDFGDLCRAQGWFQLQTVVPFHTRFDPDQHHAIGGRDIDGAAGLVVALKVVGRQAVGSTAALERAQVIVGR